MNNGILALRGNNNSITDNDVYDNWNTGIHMHGPSDFTVEGNTVTNNSLYSFNGEGTAPNSDGGIAAAGAETIPATAFTLKILGNTVSNNNAGTHSDSTGIWLGTGLPTAGITVEGNTFSSHDIDIDIDSQAATLSVNYNDFDGTGTGVCNNDTGSLNAENNWWSDASGPDDDDGVINGLGDAISTNVDADPWIGKADNTADHEAITETGGSATLDLTGTGETGSELDVDMNSGESGTFAAVEETGEPTQGFTGMGADGGIEKTITITTDADDGTFVMCVKFYYTDDELTVSGVSEDDLRLCYWDTADSEWKLAVDGNTDLVADPPVWLGNASPPESDLANHLGEHGVDQVNNIAWAVVDHCTEYGAGEGPPGEGEFEVSPPSVTVTFTPTSMTPMHEQTVTVAVTVDSDLTLADLTGLEFKVWYDEGANDDLTTDISPENGIPDEFENKTADTRECAIITWVASTDAWSIDPTGTDTTWELKTCSKPADMGATSGDFTLKFTPGKVATEADGITNIWQLAASVGSTHGGNGFDYEASTQGAGMDWYGCLILSSDTITVDWGVVPAGMDFTSGLADQTLSATITIISNGAYDLKAKAGDWTGLGTPPTNTASLDYDADLCAAAQEFALKADIDDTFEDADVLDATGVIIVDGGTATTEGGTVYGEGDTPLTLWLKLANTFASDTYSGLITYMIANG